MVGSRHWESVPPQSLSLSTRTHSIRNVARPTLLSPQKALAGGLHPGMAKSPPENGSLYFAQYEVFHQLHCLDLLRKSNHFNWDYYAELGKTEWENDLDVFEGARRCATFPLQFPFPYPYICLLPLSLLPLS